MESHRTGFPHRAFWVFRQSKAGSRAIRSNYLANHEHPARPIYWYGKFSNFALDTGGLIEFYPSQHLVLRAEGGNDLIFYGSKSVKIYDTTATIPATNRASAMFLFGAGWRF